MLSTLTNQQAPQAQAQPQAQAPQAPQMQSQAPQMQSQAQPQAHEQFGQLMQNPTAPDGVFYQFLQANPEVVQSVMQTDSAIPPQQKNGYYSDLASVYANVLSGDLGTAKQILSARKAAYENSGNQELAGEMNHAISMIDQNPMALAASIRIHAIASGGDFQQMIGNIGASQGASGQNGFDPTAQASFGGEAGGFPGYPVGSPYAGSGGGISDPQEGIAMGYSDARGRNEWEQPQYPFGDTNQGNQQLGAAAHSMDPQQFYAMDFNSAAQHLGYDPANFAPNAVARYHALSPHDKYAFWQQVNQN